MAPRAASQEHRLSACIADPGQYDLWAAFLSRLPLPKEQREHFWELPQTVIDQVVESISLSPVGVWTLERGMYVHGCSTPLDYLKTLPEYSMTQRAKQIRCPTLICQAENDLLAEQAPRLYQELTCPKNLIFFSTKEGAGEHCEIGARSRFHERIFSWLDTI